MDEKRLLKRKRKAIGNNTLLASVCTDLAELYTSTNQFARAVEEFQTLASIYKEENKIIEFGRAHRGIGEAYMGLFQFQNADKHFKIYYDAAIKADNNLEQQRALAMRGHLYLTWYLETVSEDTDSKSFLDQALKYFIRSSKQCQLLTDSVEKEEMVARLISNCAIVKENLEEYDEALDLYRKSIQICKEHGFYDQLYRGYISMAGLLDKELDYEESIKSYNLAVKTAKQLGAKKNELMCAALLAKSLTLIKLADFNGAKQVLVKAYKLKSPVIEERNTIENNLKVVAAMVNLEDQIISCDDVKKLKHLYEKMGDASSEKLKNYEKAIEYYKRMLECAEKYGASDKELQECYISLGATYEDNKQYREAEIYYQKEYSLCKDKLIDSNYTQCKIADLKEKCLDDSAEIKKIYETCLENCRQNGDKIEEKRILSRYVEYLRRANCHTDAFNIQQYLDNFLKENEFESEDSSSEGETQEVEKISIGEDINLSDLTDLSEDSDIENENISPRNRNLPKRTRQTAVRFKKNIRGEWPLHVAAIKGSLKMVNHWLKVGHPVNVRDHCGWLPLHEAAIHGHLDIVEVLLDHKAAINDRGGTGCKGRTPLHDACANGHLDVIELLLNRGASAVVKTDEGGTVLHELRDWHKINAPLEVHKEQRYRQLVEIFEKALEKVGQTDDFFEEIQCQPEKGFGSSQSPLKLGKWKKNPNLFDDFDTQEFGNGEECEELSSPTKKSVTNEYREVMQSLRHKPRTKTIATSANQQKRAALVAGDDASDEDWLENDLGPIRNKKRRMDDVEKVWKEDRYSVSPRKSEKTIRFKRNASFGSSPSKSVLFDNISETGRIDDVHSTYEIQDSSTPLKIHERRISSDSNSSSNSTKSKRNTQISLADLGFSSNKSKSSHRLSLKRNNSFDVKSQQKKLTNFGHTRSLKDQNDSDITLKRHRSATNITNLTQNTPSNFTQNQQDFTLFVDVEIEKKIFRVPVLYSQVQGRTIRWLAEEAAQRYASKEFKKPTLELETASGAILADDDLLSLLFPMGSLQAERVVAKVKEWTLQPLTESYKESCQYMSVDIDINLCQLLEKTSVSLDLTDQGILSKNLSPILKSLNHQSLISEINLSGNFLNTSSVNLLCTSLTTLPNLQSLNLSCTGLRSCHIAMLKNVFDGFTHNSKLIELNISHNCLRNDSVKDLAQIFANINLNSLNICNIELTEGAFAELPNVCWVLSDLRTLNVSDNQLGGLDVQKLISWTDPKKLTSLNTANNSEIEGLHHILATFENESILTLESINLTRCGVSETDLYNFLRCVPKLSNLDLKYNSSLTSISLRRILGHASLKFVNLTGCQNIFTYFETNENIWDIRFGQGKNDCVLKLTAVKNHEDCQVALISMFKEKFMDCLVEKSDDLLSITC